VLPRPIARETQPGSKLRGPGRVILPVVPIATRTNVTGVLRYVVISWDVTFLSRCLAAYYFNGKKGKVLDPNLSRG
jgi:hypothetical protein